MEELLEDELVEDDEDVPLLEDDIVEEDGAPLEEDGEEDEGEDNKTFPVKSTRRIASIDVMIWVWYFLKPHQKTNRFFFFSSFSVSVKGCFSFTFGKNKIRIPIKIKARPI